MNFILFVALLASCYYMWQYYPKIGESKDTLQKIEQQIDETKAQQRQYISESEQLKQTLQQLQKMHGVSKTDTDDVDIARKESDIKALQSERRLMENAVREVESLKSRLKAERAQTTKTKENISTYASISDQEEDDRIEKSSDLAVLTHDQESTDYDSGDELLLRNAYHNRQNASTEYTNADEDRSSLDPLIANMRALRCREATSQLYQKRLLTLLPLIRNGADVNVTLTETKGNTALHYACGIGSWSITLWLVEHGADVNAVTNAGKTPLDCVGEDNARRIRELLISRGAKRSSEL